MRIFVLTSLILGSLFLSIKDTFAQSNGTEFYICQAAEQLPLSSTAGRKTILRFDLNTFQVSEFKDGKTQGFFSEQFNCSFYPSKQVDFKVSCLTVENSNKYSWERRCELDIDGVPENQRPVYRGRFSLVGDDRANGQFSCFNENVFRTWNLTQCNLAKTIDK